MLWQLDCNKPDCNNIHCIHVIPFVKDLRAGPQVGKMLGGTQPVIWGEGGGGGARQ